jgi:hypothetical protein
VAGDPSAALQLMVAAKAPFDPADPDSVTRTILDVLWYNVFATNDAKAKLHGNPSTTCRPGTRAPWTTRA